MYADPVFDVSGAVAALNQTLDAVYPTMTVVGELANFKISKGRWVYADLKDDASKLRCFGTVYQLPGPLEDGMMIEVTTQPRLHPQFGFSLQIQSIRLVGEGSIKKAANLLQEKLQKEGLFAADRKRSIPHAPERIGVITSEQSAAYADFIKIMNARWQGVEVTLYDAQVQGESAPDTIIAGLQYFNQLPEPPEVIVMIRGGGSVDDLSAFSTEQVTRAVAASRVPTVVAIGHEVDVSLAEMAADLHASTPSNAAELLFPDKSDAASQLRLRQASLGQLVDAYIQKKQLQLDGQYDGISRSVHSWIDGKSQQLSHAQSLLDSAHPDATLKRGYAIVRQDKKIVSSIKHLKKDTSITLTLRDGEATAKVE